MFFCALGLSLWVPVPRKSEDRRGEETRKEDRRGQRKRGGDTNGE
jgi:hypothetical protein